MTRVSLAWFTILGAFGLIFPYYSLYLKEQARLSGTEVGFIMALSPLTSIAMQPLWGAVADRTGARTRLLGFLSVGAALSALVLYRARGFWAIAGATGLYSLFSVGLTPGLWSVSFAILADRGPRALGYARVAGTLGYGVMVATFPAAVGWAIGVEGPPSGTPASGLDLIFPMTAALLAGGSVIAWTLPRRGAVAARARKGQWRELAKNRAFVRLLFVSFAFFLCNQGPMALFPILVRAHGGGTDAISKMWIVMLALEVPLIAGFGVTERHLGIRRIILMGVAAAGLRWLASGLFTNLSLVTMAQVLHGVTVWGTLLAAPAYADRVVSPHLRSSAQALLALGGIGLGGTASSIIAGAVLDRYDATTLATLAGLAATGLWAIAPWLLPEPIPARSDTRHPDT